MIDATATNNELLVDLQQLLGELRERLFNYVSMVDDRPEVADEGLVLAVKLEEIISTASYGIHEDPPSVKTSLRWLKEASVHA